MGSMVSHIKEGTQAKGFENGILRRILGLRRDASREWKRLHNEELHNLHHSPNISKVIVSRRLSWEGHSNRMEES